MARKLFSNLKKSPNVWVLESSAERVDGRLVLRAGARLQEMGKLFRVRSIDIDPTDIMGFTKAIDSHKANVKELACELGDLIDWCEGRRNLGYQAVTATKTVVLEQEWPIMFYCVHKANRVTIHAYGKDLNNCTFSFKTGYRAAWEHFNQELRAVVGTFWDHLEDINSINFQQLTKGMVA